MLSSLKAGNGLLVFTWNIYPYILKVIWNVAEIEARNLLRQSVHSTFHWEELGVGNFVQKIQMLIH